MADYGIKVKKSLYNGAAVNKNVDACSDFELAYSSKFIVPKQFAAAGGTLLVDGFTTSWNISPSHNLGYIPMYAVFIEISPGDNNRQLITGSGYFGSGQNFSTTATTTDITIIQANPSATLGTYHYFYYIFYDQVG